jgi:hypothetical protein
MDPGKKCLRLRVPLLPPIGFKGGATPLRK